MQRREEESTEKLIRFVVPPLGGADVRFVVPPLGRFIVPPLGGAEL